MHLLDHELADDHVARRAALREEHLALALARAAHERGELLPAGALPDPHDLHGPVTAWSVRPWDVVIGQGAA